MPAQSHKLTVTGKITDGRFQQARVAAEHLAALDPQLHVEIMELTPADWDNYLRAKIKELGPEVSVKKYSPVIYIDDESLLGNDEDFKLWLEEWYGYVDPTPLPLYQCMGKQRYRSYIEASPYEHCYMDISVGDVPAGRIVFELFTDLLPKTCANFFELCANKSQRLLTYKGTEITRVVPGGFLQGGEVSNTRFTGGESVFEGVFEDENFAVEHRGPGILSMVNYGRHTNGSQFVITLDPASYLNKKCVAFGRVVDGMRLVRLIEKLPTNNERPAEAVTITESGAWMSEF
eukprot:GFYU01004471.1.p1 GENE.GFYU01004471.1~~GFYU01004471.1.p1  ORF type:complete len:290 (-),score=78.55 GFYU01004471.1:88-957(-)